MTQLTDVREFEETFLDYKQLLDKIGERVGGEHWFSAATPEERKRVEDLRYQLNRMYGRVRVAIAEANGGIPILGNAYTTAGEVPQVALADPSDNPWIESALDGTQQLIGMTLGSLERSSTTPPIADHQINKRHRVPQTARLADLALSTTQQVIGGVASAIILTALAGVLLTQCGISLAR